MNIIIDTNILFSFMNPKSMASFIFESGDLEFIAPKFILSELDEHSEECQRKSSLSSLQFKERRSWVESRIIFVDSENYKSSLKKAVRLISDLDDAPYLALALHLHLPIWSNDPHFKEQQIIPVFTTKELLFLM
ncbi:MAG: PIN domain-containing protein [Nanoarchaeota archaeon]